MLRGYMYCVGCTCSEMIPKAILQTKDDSAKLVHFVVTPAKHHAAADICGVLLCLYIYLTVGLVLWKKKEGKLHEKCSVERSLPLLEKATWLSLLFQVVDQTWWLHAHLVYLAASLVVLIWAVGAQRLMDKLIMLKVKYADGSKRTIKTTTHLRSSFCSLCYVTSQPRALRVSRPNVTSFTHVVFTSLSFTLHALCKYLSFL